MARRIALVLCMAVLSALCTSCSDDEDEYSGNKPGDYEFAPRDPRPDRPAPETFQQRRDQYLADMRWVYIPKDRFIVHNDKIFLSPNKPDPGKYMWAHLLAELADDPSGDQKLSRGDATVKELASALARFENMFHFNADGPIACMLRHPGVISPADREHLCRGHKRSVLGRTVEKNFNLYTGEGTENHIAMSRYSGYLYAQEWLKDHPDDAEARRRLGQAKEYILRHVRDVYRAGSGEFNSSTYMGYHMRGLFACYDFADDPAVRAAVKAMLDLHAAELALKCFHGLNAGTESRGRAKQAGAEFFDQLIWLWFGVGPQPQEESLLQRENNLVYAAISTYQPPEILAGIARKEGMAGTTYLCSHPSYLLDVVGHSREMLHFGDSFTVASLQLPVAGYTGAVSQFTPAKIVSKPAGGAPAWVAFGNDNAVNKFGGGRGPYTQWAQHDSVLVQMTFVPERADELRAIADKVSDQWAADFAPSFEKRWGEQRSTGNPVTKLEKPKHRIASYLLYPATDEYQLQVVQDQEAGIVFLAHGETFLAVRSLAGATPEVNREYVPTPEARGRRKPKPRRMAGWSWLLDHTEDGNGLAGLVVEVASRTDVGSLEQFRLRIKQETRLDTSHLSDAMKLTYTSLAGEKIEVTYRREAAGPVPEPIFDWGYIPGPQANHPMPVPTKPPFVQPVYPPEGESLQGWGRIPDITVEGGPVGDEGFLDMTRPWPVFAGPAVRQQGGVLTIAHDGKRYVVDYSGDVPVWKTE